MPRIRTLKPELASDMKLASVSRDARYTFILLITQSDDEGLIPGSPRQLLGALYPHEENVSAADLAGWIGELRGIGIIRDRQTVDGAPVLEIANWSRHQRVDNKGRSVLAAQLAPLAEPRGESPRTAEDRGLDLGPRTVDRGEDQGPSTTTRARESEPNGGLTDRFEEARHRDAYLNHRRAAQNPINLDHEIRFLAEGGERPGAGGMQRAFGWSVVGEALHQLSVNGGRVTPRGLQAFCEGVVVGGASSSPARAGRSSELQRRAETVWRRYLAAGLVREGMPRHEIERAGRQFVTDGLYPDYAAFLAEYLAVEPSRLVGARTDHWAVEQIVDRLTTVPLTAGAPPAATTAVA